MIKLSELFFNDIFNIQESDILSNHATCTYCLAALNMALCLTFLVCIYVIWNFFRHRPQYKVNCLKLTMNALIAILLCLADICTCFSEGHTDLKSLVVDSARTAAIFLLTLSI